MKIRRPRRTWLLLDCTLLCIHIIYSCAAVVMSGARYFSLLDCEILILNRPAPTVQTAAHALFVVVGLGWPKRKTRMMWMWMRYRPVQFVHFIWNLCGACSCLSLARRKAAAVAAGSQHHVCSFHRHATARNHAVCWHRVIH